MDIDEPTSTFIETQEGADDDWEQDQPYQPSASASTSSTHPAPFPSSTFAASCTGQADKEWSSMREKYTNDGFREGITSGKLSTLQSGFDSGYVLSSLPSRQLGNLRGRASSLLALLLLLSPPPPQPTSSSNPTRTTTTKPTSSASSLTSHLTPTQREKLVEDTRSLVRDLSRIKMLDVVGRDLEADEHTRTHGEGGEGGAEWQEGSRKEMDELEGLMEGMTGEGGKAKEQGVGEKGEGGKLNLEVGGVVEGRLRELMRRAVGGGVGKEEGMEM